MVLIFKKHGHAGNTPSCMFQCVGRGKKLFEKYFFDFGYVFIDFYSYLYLKS